MYFQKTIFISIFILSILASHSYAQQNNSSAVYKKNQYYYTYVSNQSGLYANGIEHIIEDEKGFLWMGTQRGLCCFDGTKALYFQHPNSALARVSGLKMIQKSLYVCYYLHDTIYQFDIEHCRFTGKKLTNQIIHGQPSNTIQSTLWWRNLSQKYNINWTYSVNIYDSITQYFLYRDSLRYAHGDFLTILAPNMPNNIKWGGLQDSMLFILSPTNKKVYLYRYHQCIYQGKSIEGIHSSQLYSQNTRYFTSSLGESYLYVDSNIYLLYYDKHKIRAQLLLEGFGYPNIISVLYSKKNDKIFIGTIDKGFFMIHRKQFKILTIPKPFPSNVFYSQINFSGGILANEHILYPNNSIKNYPYGKNNLVLASHDSVFIHTENQKDVQYLIFKTPTQSKSYVFVNEIKDVIYTGTDSVNYILCRNKLYTMQRGHIVQLLNVPTLEFNCIQKILNNRLLIGGMNGLYEYIPASKKLHKLYSDINVREIYHDRYQRCWLGTYGSGYYMYENNKIYRIPQDKHNRLRFTHSFYLDNHHRLWISTNNGLLMANYNSILNAINDNKKPVHYSIFTTEQGLLTDEFNGGCSNPSLVLPNGSLSLPSMNGLVLFHPDSLRQNFFDYQTTILSAQVNEKIQDLSQALIFPSSSTLIKFTFGYPNYEHPENISFEYYLEGYSTSWQNCDDVLEFRGLQTGQYNLRIRIVGEEKTEKSLFFSIEKKWHETWLFRLILLLTLVLVGYLIALYRQRTIKQRNKELENIVTEKTENLTNTIDVLDKTVAALENSESELQSLVIHQNELLQLVLHDLRGPIQSLRYTLNDIKKKTEKYPQLPIRDDIRSLEHSIHSIQYFVQNFFQWIYSRRLSLEPDIREFKAEELIYELRHSYLGEYPIRTHFENLIIKSDFQMLVTILRNLIDNANKAATSGEIILTIKKYNNTILCSIENHGKQVDETTMSNLVSDTNDSKGFGYKIIKKLLKLIDGTIQIESQENKTIVTIILNNSSDNLKVI